MSPTKVFQATSGNLMLVALFPEERGPDFLLRDPPRMFALKYDLENDVIRTEHVSWATAEALAPADFRVLERAVGRARGEMQGTSV